jgi:hypothetical protein
MVVILVPNSHVVVRGSVGGQDPRSSFSASQTAASLEYVSVEHEFTDSSMQSQMSAILSLASVGSDSSSFKLYALYLPDRTYIDYRSPSKDFAAWNLLQQMHLIGHPEVVAEVHGSALRRLQQEVSVFSQQALKNAEEKTAGVTEAVKRCISVFHELKKKNRASDEFMWDLLADKYCCIDVFMEVLCCLHPGSSLHREILHALSNCIQSKHGRHYFLVNEAQHVTGLVDLLQSKSIATIKVALHIVASLLRAKNAYRIIKQCIKAMCRRLKVPQWSILVNLLAENDVDVRYSALSLIIQLARASSLASSNKLTARVTSTKFFVKMEVAGIKKGLVLFASSNIAEELKLVDQYSMLSDASPIPRSWRDCEILKQQLSILEERCLKLEEQVADF